MKRTILRQIKGGAPFAFEWVSDAIAAWLVSLDSVRESRPGRGPATYPCPPPGFAFEGPTAAYAGFGIAYSLVSLDNVRESWPGRGPATYPCPPPGFHLEDSTTAGAIFNFATPVARGNTQYKHLRNQGPPPGYRRPPRRKNKQTLGRKP